MDPTQPFNLPYRLRMGEMGVLMCEESIRALPGRRLTCRGYWRGEEVLAKLYLADRRGKRHWRRELKGLEALRAGGVATPPLLYQGELPGHSVCLVITRFVPEGRSLYEEWNWQLGKEERLRLLDDLNRLAARHHEAGLMHGDPHLNNFLLADGELLTLDGGHVKSFKGKVGREPSLDNLALLLAQLSGEWDKASIKAAAGYAALRGWNYGDSLRRNLAARIARFRDWRRRSYMKKVFRNCSAYIHEQEPGRRLLCARELYRGELKALLAMPEQFLEVAENHPYKLGKSNQVMRLTLDGCDYVLKRYRFKNAARAVARNWYGTRAKSSWRNAHRLLFEGIETPRPVAMLELRNGPLGGLSYFLMEHTEGPTGSDYFSEQHVRMERESAVEALADLLLRLAELRLSHGDTKAGNYLIVDGRPVILDLDAMRHHRSEWGLRRARAVDIRRFLANWEEKPELQGRFLQALEARGLTESRVRAT